MPAAPRTWPLARPDLDGFEIAGSRAVPCLILHGFTATPQEVRPLAVALSDAGFAVRVPRLPGHGTDVEELAGIHPGAWLEAAEAALEEILLATPGATGIAVAGQSMGGLLALLLAARHPERIVAVASLAAPLWFNDFRARVLVPVFRWTPYLGRIVRFVPKAPSAIPLERRTLHFTYDRFPVSGVLGLGSLMKESWRALPRVRSPLFVGHGALDMTAPPMSAPRILARAGSLLKERIEFPGSRHVLTMDVESEVVCASVVDFFQRHARAAGEK